MKLEEIAKMYGTKADYLDIPSGRIFSFTSMFYDEDKDITRVPVYERNQYIGTTFMEGNWCRKDE